MYRLNLPLSALLLSGQLLSAQTISLETPPPERLGDAPFLSEIQLNSSKAFTSPSSFELDLGVKDLGGPVPTSGFTIDRSNRNNTAAGYHRYFTASEGYAAVHGFTGNVNALIPGTLSSEFQDMTLRRINYYRAQAGLPADIYFTAAKNEKSQQAALIMAYLDDITHFPAADYPANPAVTNDQANGGGGIEAASKSNLSLGTFGPRSVDGQMTDDGSNNAVAGHRRWLLYSRAQEMGNGATPPNGTYPYTLPEHPAIGVVWVIGDAKPAPAPQAIAWPNEGYIPWTLVPNDGQTYPRWSYSYPGANFSSATISMTQAGTPITLIKETVANGYADNTVVWRPSGIPNSAPASDTTYTVTINGITGAPFTSTTYDVIVFDQYSLNDPAVVAGTSSPSAGTETIYNFSAVDQAEAYEARITEANLGTWLEGAEVSPVPKIIDGTEADYTLISTAYKATGSKSFHLTVPNNGNFNDQMMDIDRTILPQTGSQISFKYRRFFMHPDTKLRVELSHNDGASYATIATINGQNSIGSSTAWDSAFLSASIPVPALYLNKSVKLRLRLEPTGSTYLGTGNTYGLHIDDIAVSNSLELNNPNVLPLASDVTSFGLTPASAGQQFYLQVRAQLGDHWFGYGDSLVVTSVSPPSPPAITSAITATGEQGANFLYSITATNTPTSYSASGLPASATINTSTGQIIGSLAPGTYNGITIGATNAGGTGNAALTIQIRTGYEATVASTYPGLGAPDDDDDKDGIPNIVELAILGMDPTTPDANLSPTGEHSGSNFVMTINKSGINGIDYTVKGSGTLLPLSWSTANLNVVTDDANTLEVSYPIDLSTNYYLRLFVTQNNSTTTEP